MSDNDMLRRGDVLDILNDVDEGEIDSAYFAIRALPAVQPGPALLEAACRAAHDAYEAAAHEAGWTTNPQSRKPWAEVPEANKVAMRAGIGAALALLNTATEGQQ